MHCKWNSLGGVWLRGETRRCIFGDLELNTLVACYVVALPVDDSVSSLRVGTLITYFAQYGIMNFFPYVSHNEVTLLLFSGHDILVWLDEK